MDDLWHLRPSSGLNRNYSQSSPLSTSQNQIETLSGPFGHPFVQQEVCVIERTIRQESVGANLLNFGLQGPSIKSIRGDVGNSLLALVPDSQHQVRSSYQSVITTQSPILPSNTHAYQIASGSSLGVGSWPGHVSNRSAGNRASGASSGLVGNSSINMSGREVTLSMLGREVNRSEYSRMSAEQDCLESSAPQTSGVEMSKHNDNSNDIGGQCPYPPWLTEIISSRQRGQNTQSPTFASGASFPRVSESSRDGSSVMSSLAALAPTLMREARVVCINYDTGQRIGGELYLTQLGLLGVICSCHGSHMSVAKFTQHVGIYSTNPGHVVAMDGTGESLVEWRKTLFSLYGIKVPHDNRGWNWSEGAVSESRPTKYKEVVTQGWQKKVDVCDGGEHLVKSRLSQNWDASVSPRTAAHFPLAQNSGSLGLSSNLGEGCVLNSRETLLKSFERAFRGSPLEFGSCRSTVEDMGENVGRCQGLPDMHSCRSSSTEFINFISGNQQLVAGHAEQQLAVEHQIAVGSRSLLKGLDLACPDRRESFQHEKDNSLSSFELKLGQPSQQSQPTGPPVSSAGSQMHGVLQRGLDIAREQNIHNRSATAGAGLHRFSGCEEPSDSRLFNQPSFETTSYMDTNHQNTCRVDSNRGVEGNGSVLVDPLSFKGAREVSTVRFVENLKERENRLHRNADQCSSGMRRWSSVGCVSSSFMLPDGLGMNTEHPAKRWADEAQLQMGVAPTPFTQGHHGLDAVSGQEWMSKSRPSENQAAESSGAMAGRGGQASCGESLIHKQRDCTPSRRREVCSDGKAQFAYEDMIMRGTREGQGCVFLNTAKATTTIMKGRILSKVGEDDDVCMNEANQEGNHAEGDRHRVNTPASQRPTTQGCSSPRGCRLRYFQAVNAQACSCGAKLVGELLDQGYKGNSLAGNAHASISVAETDRGFDKKLLNQERLVATSSSRESNYDTIQWKEMSENFVPGNGTVPDATQDDMSSPRPLAEDLLVDVVANVNSGVVVNSKISDKQQDVSEICSKSSENLMSGFSDGVGAEEEVSNAHSVEKMSVASTAVNGASRIGKCSSSAGVDTGIIASLNMSGRGNHNLNEGSPSSQGNSSLCNGAEGSRTKVKTRSSGGHAVKEPAARHIVQGTSVDTWKMEKRRRAMKWKRLDITTDAKKQKLSPSVNVVKSFDASQKLMEGSNVSNCLRHKNLVGFSPSPRGQDSATKSHRVIVTQSNHAALNEEHGMEVNGVNCIDSRRTDERHLTTTETLVIRVAQSSHPKKAKSIGRSRSGKIKPVRAVQDDMTCNKSAFSEMVTVDPSLVDKSVVEEPAGTGGLIPKLTASAIKSLPKYCTTLLTQSGKTGRGVLRRPSPRNATRMVSLNDIMNKPEVVAFKTPKDQDGCKAFGVKGHPNACAFTNGMNACATKDGLGAAFCKDSVQVSAITEVSKSLPTTGVKVSSPNEALKMSAMAGLKVQLFQAKDGFKACSAKGGLKAYHEKDALKVTFAKQHPKSTALQNGFPSKDGSKAVTSDFSLQANHPKKGLKVSGPIASALKDNFKESGPKSAVKKSVTVDKFDVAASACSKTASSKSQPNSRAPKIDVHVPAQYSLKLSSRQEVSEASRPENGLKTPTLRDRLKTFASRDASQDSFCFDVDIGSVPRDVSNAVVFTDGSRSFVHTQSMEAPPNAKTEGKGSRRPDSSLARAVGALDDHDNLSSQAGNSMMESKTTTRNRPEVRKVRSLYELISEKNLPGTGTGVFEFHDEDLESSGIVKQDSVSRPVLHSDSTFTIPVHCTDSKCLVPRGERSPRGKPSKTLFLQRHEAGNLGGGKLGGEPVEIVVSRRLVQVRKPSAGTPMRIEKEIVTEARLCPVTPRIWSPQKNKTKCEIGDGTASSAQVASSLNEVKELLGKGMLECNTDRSHKRVAEPEISVNDFKRQKLIEPSRASQFRSGLLKARHALPISRPTTPTTPSLDKVGLQIEDNKMGPVTIEDDLTIPGRKKRSQRQKRFDCQVPKGVVECCVCGSSISEFFNQIVCCSSCPVKVHQACYGVKKIPNSPWCCRTCKATAKDPICVLCGYGGGAMTRAQKALGFLKGLVKVWQENLNAKEKAAIGSPPSVELHEIGTRVDHYLADHQHWLETPELIGCSVRGKATREPSDFDSSYLGCIQRLGKPVPREKRMACNTVSSGLLDSTVVQWVHMVCALWMPGTRCLNFGTMGVFDVSGVSQARRKLVCSICNRKGGACVQCRVAECGVPFHAWCAHEKGLLQSEIVEDGSDQVGFFGKCLRHGKGGDLLNDVPHVTGTVADELGPVNGMSSSCARTEGFAGKLTLEQRALLRRKATRNGSAAVSPEQVAAWLRINERKICKARRFLKSANTDQKTDHREYLRFKQEQGWRRLSVYKSGIHALGLYTAEFIGRGEMVVEYIGEIVGLRVADKREADYHSGKRMQYQGACYLFRIDRERIIDATRKGGIARFVNHSCSPNCVAKVICVKNQSKVVFFAQRDIYAGEEITYDYQFNFEQEGDKIPCFCGSANCRGTLN